MDTDSDDERIAVNPMYVPLQLSENSIEFRVGPFVDAKHTITDNEGEGIIGELVEYLDGTRSTAEIVEQFDQQYRRDVHSVLQTLRNERVLVDVSDRAPDPLSSYSVLDGNIDDGQLDRLRESTVGVVTRGRIGGMVAADLVETGVPDVRVKPLGDTRAPDHDDRLTIVSEEIESLVSAVDYVIYADDAPGMEFAKRVNESAIETETPMTVGQLLGVEGILGPTIVPGESPCLECLLDRWRGQQSSVSSYEAFVSSSHADNDAHLPAHSRLLAGYVSKEAITQLLTGHGHVVGRTLDINLLRMDLETNEVLKLPRCSVCGVGHADEQNLVTDELLDTIDD